MSKADRWFGFVFAFFVSLSYSTAIPPVPGASIIFGLMAWFFLIMIIEVRY